MTSIGIGQGRDLPPALDGFEGIKRYWDNAMSISSAKLMPGEVYVSGRDEITKTSYHTISGAYCNWKCKSIIQEI